MSEIAPAGLHELGLEVEEEEIAPVAPPAGVLVDALDPATGDLRSMTERLHPVDASVIFNFRVVFGSGVAVSSIGHRFKDVKKVDDQAQRKLADEARRVMAPFEAKRHVKVTNILTAAPTDAGEDTGGVVVVYTNLLNGQPDRKVLALTRTA